jgi:hypothetical protein
MEDSDVRHGGAKNIYIAESNLYRVGLNDCKLELNKVGTIILALCNKRAILVVASLPS